MMSCFRGFFFAIFGRTFLTGLTKVTGYVNNVTDQEFELRAGNYGVLAMKSIAKGVEA